MINTTVVQINKHLSTATYKSTPILTLQGPKLSLTVSNNYIKTN